MPASWLAARGHAEPFQAFFHGGLALRHAVNVRDEIQIFLDGQVFVEAEPLRHVADVLLDLAGIAADVEAQTASAAAVGREQTAEHPQKRRFAAAVRAEKTVNLPAPHLHGNVVHDRAVAEPLRDALHVNHEIRSRSL